MTNTLQNLESEQQLVRYCIQKHGYYWAAYYYHHSRRMPLTQFLYYAFGRV